MNIEAICLALEAIREKRPTSLPWAFSRAGVPRPGRSRVMGYAEGYAMLRNIEPYSAPPTVVPILTITDVLTGRLDAMRAGLIPPDPTEGPPDDPPTP